MVDHLANARQEELAKKARREWYQVRIQNIRDSVTAYDVLRRNGVDLNQVSDNQEEQFSCPFHGEDRKPSARVYPADGRSPSHAWCFVCQERWDVISLWQKFGGGMPFVQALSDMEQTYRLTVPDMPSEAAYTPGDYGATEELETFDNLYKSCENRLREARPAYKQLDAMNAYLAAGSLLDKLRYQIDHGKLPIPKGLGVLRQLLDKIGEKERSCPVG